jgi:hypothetical protein
MVVNKLKKITLQLKSFDYLDIPYSSLLIIYDAEYFQNIKSEKEIEIPDDKLNVKIIDFAYFEKQENNNEIELNSPHYKNIINAIENIILFLQMEK